MEKMNAVNLEKMYEVLKFVEYGGYCRRSMDCVHGMLLIDRMKTINVVDKQSISYICTLKSFLR